MLQGEPQRPLSPGTWQQGSRMGALVPEAALSSYGKTWSIWKSLCAALTKTHYQHLLMWQTVTPSTVDITGWMGASSEVWLQSHRGFGKALSPLR